MKYMLPFIYLMSVISCFGQSKKDENTIKIYKEIINVLANDSLNGRAASSIYEDKSAQFIIKKLIKFNKQFQTQIQQFNYVRVDSESIKKSKNLYSYIDNKANNTILIGAHYDHLGMGDGLSRSYGKKGIHNGADDNASGVALVLSLAQKFTKWENKKYNYLFVFYSAHEIGLFGSAAFSKFAQDHFKPIVLALNFDMIGRLDMNQKILNIYGINTLLYNQLELINTLSFDGIIRTNFSDKIYECDLKKFAEAKIPSLSFTTGIHSDYHKITDDEDQINYFGILQIEKYILQLLNKYN
jgi:Zn-dependent M28 family amino/carboxypeptidase